MMHLRKVQALLDEHPDLHTRGYGNPPGGQISDAARAELLTPPALARIHAALHWIEANLVPAGRYQTRAHRSSYAYKHVMQNDTGLYVTNGEFIAAALLSHISVNTHYYNPLLHAAQVPAGSRA